MAKQFGDPRSRKDVYNEFVKDVNNVPKKGQIGNVNTLSDFESQTSGNFNSPAPNSADNLQYSKNVNFLRDYFKDGTMHHFKNGLELANKSGNQKNLSNIENLDEDPVIFGFDFIINHVTSPLFQSEVGQGGSTDIDDFFEFAQGDGNFKIDEIANRKGLYEDFIRQLELLFLSTRGGPFDTFKGHYLIGIDGVGDLINKSTGLGSEKQFANFGKDKITLTLREDSHLSGGYLTALYNAMSYSKINGKQLIPDNLLRFDATIVVSEMRNYKKVKKAFADPEGLEELTKVVSDNVSRYMYNVYDCQFYFDKHSHPGKVQNDTTEVTDSFDLSFFYKFSTMEMEKFKLTENALSKDPAFSSDTVKYFNDGNRENPTRKYIGEQTENINAVRRNEFINSKYQESLDSYQEFNNVKSNNIEKINEPIGSEDTDELSALKQNSLTNSLEEQEQQRQELAQQASERQQRTGLKKDEANTAIGYEVLTDGGRLTRQERRGREGGLGGIIEKSKDFALNVVRLKRNLLINETVQNIRRSTGLRRMSQPDNVYDFDPLSVTGFVRDQLTNFAGNSFTDLLGGIDDAI